MTLLGELSKKWAGSEAWARQPGVAWARLPVDAPTTGGRRVARESKAFNSTKAKATKAAGLFADVARGWLKSQPKQQQE